MRATHHPRATRHIGEILVSIRRPVGKGHAHAAGGGVYFDVSPATLRRAEKGEK